VPRPRLAIKPLRGLACSATRTLQLECRGRHVGYLFPRDAQALNALAEEAGQSRIWAGIHFLTDVSVCLG
jgi:hypothetical protein